MGASACIIVDWYLEHYEETGDFQPLAWWIHDHLPYSGMCFFPKLCAFNIGWHESRQKSSIYSYVAPKGRLTQEGAYNYAGSHREFYKNLGFPKLKLA